MGAEIVEHAGALIAPIGIANQPRRAIAVEHAAAIDRTQCARSDEVAHPYEMRLEAVVVGGIEDGALLPRFLFEP